MEYEIRNIDLVKYTYNTHSNEKNTTKKILRIYDNSSRKFWSIELIYWSLISVTNNFSNN